MSTKAIAFYLPQYHPIPENDQWWGKGFTEWRNVTQAKPLFPGHNQPHQPADLGYYDLRLAETREAQAQLARTYGIYGFCYYHYWFNGKLLLERPIEENLKTHQPDFPFCLCWANENWTRAWDGLERKILIRQEYSLADDLAHFRYLSQFFSDPRYIRVEGKPLFLIYRATAIPEIQERIVQWREHAKRIGIGEIFLCNVESFPSEHGTVSLGFDAAVEFAPDWNVLRPQSLLWKMILKIGNHLFTSGNKVFPYAELARRMAQKPTPSYLRIPCVCPAWDNSARRQKGATIFRDSHPKIYENWLKAAVEKAPHIGESKFVFINAWNEWAEGNHLEPCQQWGHAYLEATRNILSREGK